MNIFEYLGLPALHRKLSNKVTQLVKHWDEVVAKHKVGKKFGIQVKKDGVCTLTIIKDNNVSIWSRTGKQFTNTEELVEKIRMLNMPDGVYMGEMTCDSISLEVLSGIVNPNRVNALKPDQCCVPMLLQMNWFDKVNIAEFRFGSSSCSFQNRFHSLEEAFQNAIAKYGNFHPDIHLLPYQVVTTEEEIDSLLDYFIAMGEEGLVIRDLAADWEAGHKGWRVMKKVRGVDYDLLCIGVEEGTGKYAGKAANLLFKWKGDKTIKCMLGKGWTHDDAAYFWVNQPIGSVFQVYALEESSKGLLRLPKVGEKRFDKEESDV